MQSQDRCTRGQQFAGQLFFFLQPKSTAPARRTRRSRSRRQFYHLNAVKHWSARPRVCAPLTRRSARRPCFRPHCETASVILQFVANETKKPLFSYPFPSNKCGPCGKNAYIRNWSPRHMHRKTKCIVIPRTTFDVSERVVLARTWPYQRVVDAWTMFVIMSWHVGTYHASRTFAGREVLDRRTPRGIRITTKTRHQFLGRRFPKRPW